MGIVLRRIQGGGGDGGYSSNEAKKSFPMIHNPVQVNKNKVQMSKKNCTFLCPFELFLFVYLNNILLNLTISKKMKFFKKD